MTTVAGILVIDADPKARSLIASELRGLNRDVFDCDGIAAAVANGAAHGLIVCDASELTGGGVNRLAPLRSDQSDRTAPVIVTALHAQADEIPSMLADGVDDFIIKPVDLTELRLRAQVWLQRGGTAPRGVLSAGAIRIDDANHRVYVDDCRVELAPREYRLLLFLLRHPNRVHSRSQLLGSVWGASSNVGPRTVDVHIRRLRSILEPFGHARHVQTVRGSGYRFSLED